MTQARDKDDRATRRLRQIDAQLDREVGALRRELARGPRRGETRQQLAERLVQQLTKIIHRHANRQWAAFFPRGGPGRPRARFPPLPRTSSMGRGAPKKFTREVEEWWIAEIDRLKAYRVARDKKLGDAAALREHMFRYYTKRYLDQGLPKADAMRRARVDSTGPVFRRRKEHLSRLRRRGSPQRR